jgi:hypothetical protein
MGRSSQEHTREFMGSATSMLNPGAAAPLSLCRVGASQAHIRFELKRIDPCRISSFVVRLARIRVERAQSLCYRSYPANKL